MWNNFLNSLPNHPKKQVAALPSLAFCMFELFSYILSDGKLLYQFFQMNRIAACGSRQLLDVCGIPRNFIGIAGNRLTAFRSLITFCRDITDRRIHLI